jgi:hypothetical protein
MVFHKFVTFSIMRKTLLAIILSLSVSSVFAEIPAYFNYFQNTIAQIDTSVNELKIYPNPAKTGKVTLEMNSGEISEVRLINIAGKEVITRKMEFGTSKYELALENIPSGIYFVSVKSPENKTVVKKLIVSSR